MNTIGKISKFGIIKFALMLARPPVDCSFRLDVLSRVHASIYTYVAPTIMANRFPPVTVLLARPPVDCSFRLDVLFRVHSSIYTYVGLTIMANRFPPVTVFAGVRRELGTSII